MDYKINNKIKIDAKEIKFEFIRASGPGGQNVNKVATAAQLRFNIVKSKAFSNETKELLIKKLKPKLTHTGEIIITARRYRNQEQNRKDAIDRLIRLLSKTLEQKKKRKPTKVTAGSKEARLKQKKLRGEVKKLRSKKIKPE